MLKRHDGQAREKQAKRRTDEKRYTEPITLVRSMETVLKGQTRDILLALKALGTLYNYVLLHV